MSPRRIPPPKGPRPVPPKRPIDAAIDRVQQPQDRVVSPSHPQALMLLDQALRLEPTAALRIVVSDPDAVQLLVVDSNAGAWRPVLLPAGSTWVLRLEESMPKLWQP